MEIARCFAEAPKEFHMAFSGITADVAISHLDELLVSGGLDPADRAFDSDVPSGRLQALHPERQETGRLDRPRGCARSSSVHFPRGRMGSGGQWSGHRIRPSGDVR